jgi:hypothetical protein
MTSKNVKYYVWLDRPDDVQRKPVNLPFKFIFEFFPVILPFNLPGIATALRASQWQTIVFEAFFFLYSLAFDII